MAATEFTLNLGDDDYAPNQGGWRLPALPGVKVVAVFVSGASASTDKYKVEHNLLRWVSAGPRPKDLSAVLELTRDLAAEIPALEQAKMKLEERKLELEKSKGRWQAAAVVLTFLGVVLGFAIPRGEKPPSAGASAVSADAVARCRKKLGDLDAMAQKSDLTKDDLRAQLRNELGPCIDLVKALDEP